MKLDLKHHEKKQCWDNDSSPCAFHCSHCPYPLLVHAFPQGNFLKIQRYNDPSCPRYGLITEEEAKAAERYDALMEHSEAIANAPKKQTEAYVVADVCQNPCNLQHSRIPSNRFCTGLCSPTILIPFYFRRPTKSSWPFRVLLQHGDWAKLRVYTKGPLQGTGGLCCRAKREVF